MLINNHFETRGKDEYRYATDPGVFGAGLFAGAVRGPAVGGQPRDGGSLRADGTGHRGFE